MVNRLTRLLLSTVVACGLSAPVSLRAQAPAGLPGPPPPDLAPPAPAGGAVPSPDASEEPAAGPLTNAFSEQDPHGGGPAGGVYFTLGTQALRRQGLAHGAVTVLDPGVTVTTQQSASIPVAGQDGKPGSEPPGEANPRTVNIAGTVSVTEQTFNATGNLPPAGAPAFGDFSQVDPRMTWGFKAALGYRLGDGAVEASGFYVSQNQITSVVASSSLPAANPATVSLVSLSQSNLASVFDPDRDGDAFVNSMTLPTIEGPPANQNRLDLPFFNAPSAFSGLFLQADKVTLAFETRVGNAEVNYRYGGLNSELAVLAGFRYVDIQETYSMLVDADPVSPPDRVALYQTQAHNHLIAPQLGLEWRKELVPGFAVDVAAKGAWGVNLIDTSVLLERGDGLIGFQGGRHNQRFGQVYELGFMADWAVAQAIHLRAGYTAFWVLGLAEATGQIDFDLSNANGHDQHDGHVLYHGPTVEVMFTF